MTLATIKAAPGILNERGDYRGAYLLGGSGYPLKEKKDFV